MPSRLQKKRTQNKKYFKDHKEKLLLQACEIMLLAVIKKMCLKRIFLAHKEQRLAYHSKYHEAHKEERKACFND